MVILVSNVFPDWSENSKSTHLHLAGKLHIDENGWGCSCHCYLGTSCGGGDSVIPSFILRTRMRRLAQWIKCLSCKHKNQSAEPT